jgi:nitrogen fixation NifU-like protein
MSYRDVFGEILADHHESPRNFGPLSTATQTENGFNPLCGDQIKIQVQVKDPTTQPVIETCQFEGEGCSICMASASILTEMVKGKSIAEVDQLIEAFRDKMQGKENIVGLPADNEDQDIVALYGIKRFPVRIKCVLLAWTTLKRALHPENKVEGKV